MLLNIERVLKMLAEGKSVEKIAERGKVSPEEVYALIEEARRIILLHDGTRAKKKVLLKKFSQGADAGEQTVGKDDLLSGAELSAIPMGASLIFYTDGASSGNPGPAGIGIVIFDAQDRQVGKVSLHIGETTNNIAEYSAVIRALKIALYFQAKNVRVRTDSELVVRQLNGQYKVKNEGLIPYFEQVSELMKQIPKVKVEYIPRNQNEKADFLAKKASAGK